MCRQPSDRSRPTPPNRYKEIAAHRHLLGHSAGGHLVCRAAVLADPSTQVQAIVGLAPVRDFEQDTAKRGGSHPAHRCKICSIVPSSPTRNAPVASGIFTDQSRQAGLAAVSADAGGCGQNRRAYDDAKLCRQAQGKWRPLRSDHRPRRPVSVTAWRKIEPNNADKLTAWLRQNLTTQPAGA